jgi:hypothetical protein
MSHAGHGALGYPGASAGGANGGAPSQARTDTEERAESRKRNTDNRVAQGLTD